MGTLRFLAVAPDRPALELGGDPADPEATAQALARVLPGRAPEPVRSGAFGDTWAEDGEVRTVLVGSTLLIGDLGADDVEVPDGQGSWAYELHTTTDSHVFGVRSPEWQRELVVDGQTTREDVEQIATGTPLPPEEPFWAGERDRYDDPAFLRFDPGELADECLRWMYGGPLRRAGDGDVDLAGLTMHVFRVGAATDDGRQARTPPPAGNDKPRRRWWRRG